MITARYEELLGSLLEGELSAEEAGELAAGLNARPELRRDLTQHLILWELWSQHLAPERSAEAFIAAWKTRLRAENEGADAFGQGVLAQVQGRHLRPQAGPQVEPRVRSWWRYFQAPGVINRWIKSLGAAILRPAGIAWAAALVCAGLFGLLWLATPQPAQAMITIRGDAVCTACVLHESHTCGPAIRVTAGGITRIYYLDRTQAMAGLQSRFCNGPTPTVAEGTMRTEAGRLLLAARTVTFPGAAKPREKPKPDERVIFPI